MSDPTRGLQCTEPSPTTTSHQPPNHIVSIYEAAYQYCCQDGTIRFLHETLSQLSHRNTNITTTTTTTTTIATIADHNQVNGTTKVFHNKGVLNQTEPPNPSPQNRTIMMTSNDGEIDIIEDWDGRPNFGEKRHKSGVSDDTSITSRMIGPVESNASVAEHATTTLATCFLPRPCLIRDCTLLQQCFALPRQAWILQPEQQQQQQQQQSNDATSTNTSLCNSNIEQSSNSDGNNNIKSSRIHREWFLDICEATSVPVYYHYSNTTIDTIQGTKNPILDTEGRVVECPMRHMTIQQYLTDTDCFNDEHDEDDNHHQRTTSRRPYHGIPYLKDWHFQFWYEQQQQHQQGHAFHYSLPNYLPYDLLNGFLLRFDPVAISVTSSSSNYNDTDTTNRRMSNSKQNKFGTVASDPDAVQVEQQYMDYRFVYWGPRHSRTDIHTDVLLSLSWSYNVHGTKLWTFYIPTTSNLNNKNDNPNETVISIEQKTGELMMVPSGMRHSVINLEETLSINHNWITTDILPQVWQCIRTELIAVDHELSSWDSTWTVECFHARESMLRGCVGLNVSLYFFMILTRGLDLIKNAVAGPNVRRQADSIHSDLIHIRNSLLQVYEDPTIYLKDRLAATLQNDVSSEQAIRVGMDCVKVITLFVN